MLAGQQQPDHHCVFVAVADEQRSIVFEMRQSRDEFRLRAAFQAETKRAPRFENLLHHFMKLVHLDRIHADIRVLVARFLDGFPERIVQFRHARPEKILKADKEWKLDSLGFQILNDFVEIDADRIAEDRANTEISFVVNGEIVISPQLHSIEIFGIFSRPDCFFSFGH